MCSTKGSDRVEFNRIERYGNFVDIIDSYRLSIFQDSQLSIMTVSFVYVCLGPFTPQIIFAVVCSWCGGLEKPFHSAQLTCSVLLVVEVTKQFPGHGLVGSRLTKI